MTIHFDTLDYAKTLEGAGMVRAHAEAIARVQTKALSDLVANDLVTKDFLRSELTQVETRLNGRIDKLATELRGEISQLGTDLRGEIGKQGTDLRGEIAQLGIELRGEMLQMETRLDARLRQETDAIRLQLRSLQYGGAIAAFAVSLVVLLSRLIK